MKKLAVFFPGIGYTVDKPLLYYSRKIAAEHGYEVKLLPYTGFPAKIRGDRQRMAESFRIAREQSLAMLQDVSFADYDRILFAGKSIGTAVAAEIAAKSPFRERILLLLYTPLEETLSFAPARAVAFTGSADPWVGGKDSRIAALCESLGIPCHVVADANHSLETGHAAVDIRNMQMIMQETEAFLQLYS